MVHVYMASKIARRVCSLFALSRVIRPNSGPTSLLCLSRTHTRTVGSVTHTRAAEAASATDEAARLVFARLTGREVSPDVCACVRHGAGAVASFASSSSSSSSSCSGGAGEFERGLATVCEAIRVLEALEAAALTEIPSSTCRPTCTLAFSSRFLSLTHTFSLSLSLCLCASSLS